MMIPRWSQYIHSYQWVIKGLLELSGILPKVCQPPSTELEDEVGTRLPPRGALALALRLLKPFDVKLHTWTACLPGESVYS